MNKGCLVAVWIWVLVFGIGNHIYAQAEDTCRVAYDFLWETAKQDSLSLPPNTKLSLSKEIKSTISPSAPIYRYQYLRPATRQEIKDQQVQNSELEIVKADSNIYALEKLAPTSIFFIKDHHPNDAITLQKIDSKWVISEDLQSAPIEFEEDKDIELLVQEENYWELKAGEEIWIFYPQIFDPFTVFDLPKDDTFVEKKKRKAQDLVGKTLVYLENEGSSEWKISNIIPTNTAASLILTPLDSSPSDTMHLNLSGEIAFEIYDPVCLENAKHVEAKRLAALVKEQKLAIEAAKRDSLIHAKQDSLRQDSLMKVQLAIAEEEKLQAAIQAEIEADRQKMIAEISGNSSPTPSNDVSRSPGMSPLRKKFILIKDPVIDLHWYLHENQSLEKIIKESYLKLNLNEYGEMYLLSILTTDTAFKHVKFKVNIGEYQWESDIIYTYDDRNVVETYEGYLQEKIHFTTKDTREVVEKIVENYDDNIMISFINEAGVQIDTKLSIPNRIAFKDTFMLYEELNQQVND